MATNEELNRLKQLLIDYSPSEFIKFKNAHQGIGFIMFYLYDHQDEEVLSGDLAHKLGVSTARISTLLKKIENKKYIVRKSSKNDARITIVEITDIGKKKVVEKRNEFDQMLNCFIDEIGEKDLVEFFRIAKKMREIGLKCKKEEIC